MADLTYGEVVRVYSELQERAPDLFRKNAKGDVRKAVQYLYMRITAHYQLAEWKQLQPESVLPRSFAPAFELFRKTVDDLLKIEGL